MSRPLLLIEDDEDDVFFMKRAMQQAGIDNPVAVARDGQEAIEWLEKALNCDCPELPVPCLILLDLKLPRIPGLEVLRWIRDNEDLKPVPVLVLTSSKQDQDVETAYRMGANSFFAKPPRSDALLEMMKVIKEYWLTHCIPPPVCMQA